MRLIEITDKNTLDNFVATQVGDFLQSWSWGEFQLAQGHELLRLAVTDDREKLLAVVSLIKKSLPGSIRYYFAPRGPIISSQESWDFLIKELKARAKQEKIAFLRFEPPVTDDKEEFSLWQEIIKTKNIIKTIEIEPSHTSMLDLTQDSRTLLAKMHPKTRYNIRLAEKKGVEIFKASNEDFSAWWQLLQTTGTRDGFRLHNKDYYQGMLNLDFMTLYLAKHEERVLAGILVSQFGDMATYVHGASSNEGRHLMAPHLLQWHAISEAGVNKCCNYDFYGVNKDKWPGVTKFKEGFAGQNLAYLGTFDLVWQAGYYKLYGILRRLFRFANKIKPKLVKK